MKVVLNFLCRFIPVPKWRRHFREKTGGSRRRRKRRINRILECGNYQMTTIEGVVVAKNSDMGFGHILEGDGILILEEIFKNEEYFFNAIGRFVVVDVGMNIGIASLYFAKKNEVEVVYGFEPFRPTYEKALFNFRINSELSKKIQSYNYGLGDSDKSLTLDYYSRTPGRMSTVKTLNEIHPDRKYETCPETVQIKNAAAQMRAIFEKHSGCIFVLKCDTEGAEKEIFESLNKEKLLKCFDVILLEYHFSYDVPLLNMLCQNGFVCFKQKTAVLDTGEFGMIRAVRGNL